MKYTQLKELIEQTQDVLENNPERRMDVCEQYIERNERRPYPYLFLNIGQDPNERKPIEIKSVGSAEDRLAEKLNGMVAPLELLNPIAPYVVLGVGPGSMISSFGVELDSALDYTPRTHISVDELIRRGVPDPEKSGLFPIFKEDIDAVNAYLPDFFRIEKPDMQGPFNIAHAVLGTDMFILPYTEPDKYREVMRIITEFYILADRKLRGWIGKKRGIAFPRRRSILAECSCNLVSTDFYEEFVLPYDLEICEYYGESTIHPCSGPHVFYETIRNLPNVVYTEAGKMIAPMAAGCIAVLDALAEIGSRPIVLNIGQELPKDGEYELIRADFELAKTNHRLLFGYTGGHFRQQDIPRIWEMHKRLDGEWLEHIYPHVAAFAEAEK